MATVCPNIPALLQDHKFQNLKNAYKDTGFSDFVLACYLNTYRSAEDLDMDWFPESAEDYKDFTDYLNRPIDNSANPAISKEHLDNLYKTMRTLYPSSRILDLRLGLIGSWFRSRVDRAVEKFAPGLSRQQVINMQAKDGKNGFQVLMEETHEMVKSLSTLDGQRKIFDQQNPNASDEDWENQKEFWQYRADEFAKISDNWDALAALAAPQIGAIEGISVNMDGMLYNYYELQTEDEVQDTDAENDEAIDSVEAQKGERYVDFRTLSLMSTLSTEAKNLISGLRRIDANGEFVRDDLGYPIPCDIKQTAVILHRVLRYSEPDTMMDDLQNAVAKYPSLRSLVNHLRLNPDDRGLVYSTFKKTKSLYFYGYRKKDGSLDVHSSGNAADGHSLSKEAGSNISLGVTNDSYNLVDTSGNLVSNDRIQKVSSLAYQGTPDGLSYALQAAGFSVSKEDISKVLDSYPADYKVSYVNFIGNTIEGAPVKKALEESLEAICDKAEGLNKLNDEPTGAHLYQYAQVYYNQIAEILSPLQKGETEERVISGKKSLSSSTTPNALHQLVDTISNARNVSRDAYKNILMNEFGQYEGMGLGYGEYTRLTGWLADSTSDRWNPSSFRVVDLTDSDRTDYQSLTAFQHALNSYTMFLRGGRNRIDNYDPAGSFYEVPIQSDYETAYNFIYAPRYKYNELVDRLTEEVECEVQRIAAIKERINNDSDNPNAELSRAKVNVYENNGQRFQIFPELNSNGFLERFSSANPTEAHAIARAAVDEQLRNLLTDEITKVRNLGLFNENNAKLLGAKGGKVEGWGREGRTFRDGVELPGITSELGDSVASWILNSFYARQQITKLMYGGLEFFKSTSDFEKRNMYSHATRIPLYTKATYHGEQVGKENQKVLYLSDDDAKSAILDRISNIADRLHKEGKITADQRDRMKASYESITTTDGQGIRTLDSLRSIRIMASLWTDSDEEAYKHIQSGNYRPEDVEHFMIGLKPVYTGYEIISTQPGQYQKPIRVPVLHKYSEMVLLPEMMEGVSAQNDSVPFQALNKINKKLGKGNEIDLFIFGSGVKVGGHSLVNAFATDEKGERILKDSESIANFVSNKIQSGNFWIHTLPLKYYGITAATHADIVNNNIAWASQAEKEAWANIQPNEEITVAGRKMNAQAARELYNKIKEARTIDAIKELRKLFYSNKKMGELLKEELASRPYQSRDLLFQLEVLSGGGTLGSQVLCHPSIQHDVVALLSSIIRKRLTKIPTKGANIMQTSGFGLDMDASGFDEQNALKNSDKLEVKFDENGNFMYVEAYAPIYDSRLMQFADEMGNISPDRLNKLVKDRVIPESVLNFIAYRTPSDAEHSVIPCRIKGFISNAAGPTIRLPKEIMSMTGHDYDGDKLRCHFKDFTLGWDENRIRKEYTSFSDAEVVKSVLADSGDTTPTPYEVFRKNIISDLNPNANDYKVVKDIIYDYDKEPVKNIKEAGDYRALNNALVDLMFGELTSENGHMKMFIPGGSTETTIYARTLQIMRAYGTTNGRNLIRSGLRNQKVSNDRISAILHDSVSLYKYLIKQKEKTLTGITQTIEQGASPLTVSHATDSHGYMMDGAGMIGVYAIYNSASSMFQRLNLSYVPLMNKKHEPINVSIFGKRFGNLFPVLSNGSYSTLGLARLVNAAVDNGKNPVLGHLNQTSQLAPLTNMLFAVGLDEEEVHLIFNQPIIIELARRMKSSSSASMTDCAQGILDELKNEGTTIPTQENSVSRVSGFTKDTFIANLPKTYSDRISWNETDKKNQVAILQTLMHINGAAEDLDMFTKLTRPESSSGSIDSSLGGTVSKIIQLDDFREKIASGNVRISGMDFVLEPREVYLNTQTPKMIDETIGNTLPEVVALNTFLKDALPKLFRQFFPQTRESWMRITKRIADQYTFKRIPGSVIERIQSDMILWKLMSDKDFVSGNPQEEQKRILEETPKKLRELKERVLSSVKNGAGKDALADALVNNVFLNNLELGSSLNENNEAVHRIRFSLNGPQVEGTSDLIRAGWDQLWRYDETHQLAEDLFKYNLYTNGFSYGRYEFSHYAPYSVVSNMHGFLNALKRMPGSSVWTDEEEEQFFHQYCMNHWGDKNFLVKMTQEELPGDIRTSLGLPESSKSLGIKSFESKVGDSAYIVVSSVERGRPVDSLYRLLRSESGVLMGMEPAQKLGIRNANNQTVIQYNPRIRDYREVRPYFTSNDVSWEGKKSAVTTDSAELESQESIQAAIDEIPFDTSLFSAQREKPNSNSSVNNNAGSLTAEQAAALGFEDEDYFSLRNLSTPAKVRDARERKTQEELNKRLREILREHGVSVGTLTDAEERLGAAGVSDFSTAKVFAEGLKELIRISNGIEGEEALPEEFAHVALEMLGKRTVDRDDDGNVIAFHHDNALVERLLNAINKSPEALEEAFGGMLDEYKKQYGDANQEKLVVEAAGKLVAKQLFLAQEISTRPVKSLVRRVCEAIKNFFRRFSLRKVENAVFDAEGISSQLARDLLSGRLADEMSLEKITESDKFFQLEKDLSNKKDILSKLLEKTVKRADILSRRVKYSLGKGATSRSLEETKNQIEKLEKAIQEGKLEVAIVDYMQDAMSFMKETEISLDNAINNHPANSVCKKLQIVKDTLFGFASVYEDIKNALKNGEIKDEANLKSIMHDMRDQIEDFWGKYHDIAGQYFNKFLANVYGEEGVTINVGRQKGRKITIEEMATKADRDIGFVSRWLHAASDMDDYVIQAVDRVTRDAKLEARNRVRSLRPKLEAAMAALVKEQGNRDQSWMFEWKNDEGKQVRTGRYISKEQASKLSEAKRNFYNVFMELKHEADLCVPEIMVSDRKMIMLRKEHYEKMKEAQGVSGKKDEIWENAKRSVLEMGDIDYENEQVIKDFSNNKVDQLPLKFLNKGKSETFDDMTEDAATSLMAYLGMAFEYKEMNNVIGLLENARYMSSLRDIKQHRGWKNLVEKVGDEEGFHYEKPFTVKQAKTHIQEAMNDFFQMHVYGHLRKDEGTIGKTRISIRKVVDTTNRITSLSQMAINLHQRIANVNTGMTQILVESAGGKIKAKDVAWASTVWMTQSVNRLAETGKTDYSNKLSLWMDYFDIHQDNGRDTQTTKYGRTNSSRVFNEGLLYAGLSVGEDLLAGTTALALAHTYKLKGPDGKPSNMWDAYEVKYADEANKTGGYLSLKKGYTKEDGSAITREDERAFQREVIGTNFELQGIYNTDDRSAIQQNSFGALAIMYRKWIAPAMKRRYGRTQYSNLKNDYQEGYYRTALRFAGDAISDWFNPVSEEESKKTILRILTDLHALKSSVQLNWSKLNDYERGNIKKSGVELSVIFCLFVASALIKNLPPEDEDNKFLSWAEDIAITQLLRLRSEIGSQAPTPNMLKEAGRLLNSPFAALRPLRDSLNIFQLMLPSNYFEEVESGKYKGRTKAHKYFMSLPVISMFRKFDNFVDPSPLINYYKNQNY